MDVELGAAGAIRPVLNDVDAAGVSTKERPQVPEEVAGGWRHKRDAELKAEETTDDQKQKQETRKKEKAAKEHTGDDDYGGHKQPARLKSSALSRGADDGKLSKAKKSPRPDRARRANDKKGADERTGLTPRTAKTADDEGHTGLTPRTAKNAESVKEVEAKEVVERARYGQSAAKPKKKKVRTNCRS